jgi:hypothetical protein
MPSNRLRTRYDKDSNQVLLQIDNVRPEDAGQYQVVATNPAGKDSTGGSLSVLPDQPTAKDKRPKDQERRPLEIVSSPDQSNLAPQDLRPPTVTIPLKDADVEESMPVILTTKIDAGQPTALVRIFSKQRFE